METAQELRKVEAQHLRAGDYLGQGKTIVNVSRGLRTPAGKVEVLYNHGGLTRKAVWGARTEIRIERKAVEA